MAWRRKKLKWNLGGNKCFENSSAEIIFKLKVGHENSVIWYHKYSNLIHVDQNHDNSYQPIPDDLTNILSINDSADICVIEKILFFLVHFIHTPYLVPAPPILTFGTVSDPRSSLHDTSAEIVIHKGNTTSHNNPPNLVTNIPADLDSDPSFSDSSL